MAQNSRPMPDNTSNYATSDAGPYSGDEWRERIAMETVGDPNTASERAQLRGVLPTCWDKLCVTNPAGKTITVDNGAAIVNGNVFVHDPTDAPTSVSFSPSTPTVGVRVDKVVVVLNNTNATYNTNLEFPTDLTDYNLTASIEPYSVRLAILTGVDGGAARSLVQTTDYWMIELATYNINLAGAIAAGPTDSREFADIQNIVGIHSDDDGSVEDALILGVQVDDAASGANDTGVAIKFMVESGGGDLNDAGRIAARLDDNTDGAEDTRFEFRTQAGGAENLSGVISGQTAASVDGNSRGAGAVDWQGDRANVADVAAGIHSVIGGGSDNRIGTSNDHSVISGGDNNVISGTDDNQTISGGDYNTIDADTATIGGGSSNNVSGDWGTICGGSTNDINAGSDYGVICGGSANDLNAEYASVPGGHQASADIYNAHVHASGFFSARGDAQGTIQMVARTTTAGGGAATTLYLDGAGASERMVIPASSAWTYDILCIAISQNAGAIHSSRAYGLIERDNANNTTQASTTGVVVEQAAGCTFAVSADDVNEALLLQFTDDSANVFRVVATIRLAQVTYP